MEAENNRNMWPCWETVRVIGNGSFGTVYEIERDVFGQKEKAALKVITIPQKSSDIDELRSNGFDDESITDTFKSYLKNIVDEYSLMRKMNGNTNIVNCDDVRYVQHDDGYGWDIYIKMELLTPLTKVSETGMTENQVIQIGKDICKALILCKKHNIVHRDIKPANIFVSENGDYKLGDFGIAKTVEKTSGGTKIGTYEYMAPEVYHDEPYGSAVDIYSLGLVLYWLLNERRTPFLPLPPNRFDYKEKESAYKKRFRGEPIPAPAHGSKELQQVVLKACAFRPEDRFQSANEFLTVLSGISAEYVDTFIEGAQASTTEGDTESGNTGTDDVFPGWKKPDDNPNSPPLQPPKKLWPIICAVIFLCVVVMAVLMKPTPPEPTPTQEPVSMPTITLQPKSVTVVSDGSASFEVKADGTGLSYQWQYRTSSSGTWNNVTAANITGTKTATMSVTAKAAFNGYQYRCMVTNNAGTVYSNAVTLTVATKPSSKNTIAASNYHTVAVKTNGTVVATGWNVDGDCEVGEWSNIVAVAAGVYHTVGLRADGTVVAKGYNYEGQCNVNGWTNIVAIAAGRYHTIGLRSDGTVVATEYEGNYENNYGQCDVSSWRNIVAIAAGGSHSVGLRADGTVVATGLKRAGQCDVGSWKNIVSISAGAVHTVGLRADGTVIATKYTGDKSDYDGQCDVSAWSGIISISAGWAHTIGLHSDGTVVAVGYNYDGRCDVSNWRNIVAIAGGTNTVGLRSDGTVLAVGNNENRQNNVSDWRSICLPK